MSAPAARTASGASPFTVACVPTGINAGVATGPCAVVIAPQRAAPSVAIRRKEKESIAAVVSGRRAQQQAGVAIGVEPIAGGDRMRIGALHRIEPAERRDQHE